MNESSEGVETIMRGIFALPNEILLDIFSRFSTQQLLSITLTCRHFHSLLLRLIHNRLQIAAELNGHSLYLECDHPSARLTAAQLFCTSLGTPGLEDLLSDICGEESYVGQVKRLGSIYSRFKPHRNNPERREARRHPAGDIPGSRTHPSTHAQGLDLEELDVVRDTVTVDAQELFSQLQTVAYLGKSESTRGLLVTLQEVTEGTIRVWREWLSKQCETRSFSDHSTVVIHHDGGSSSRAEPDHARSSGEALASDPKQDPNVLWVNTRDESVGIKFRVKRQKQRVNEMPLLYSSDVEVGVSYVVEYEEVYVRTAHLLLKLEEAERQATNISGKAIVFGSIRAAE